MRAVIQRIKQAKVGADNKTVGSAGRGLLIFLGVGENDGGDDIKYIADKSLCLRIFEDENGKMNLSVRDIGGDILIISQFTLYGDCRKGRRPSFDKAMKPKNAEKLYDAFVDYVKKSGLRCETGIFGADMKVELINDGPVTILLDSDKLI